MAATGILLALLLQAGIVVAALAGQIRLAGLRAFADDVRLRRLQWFFGLFGGAVAVQLLISAFLFGEAHADGVTVTHELAAMVFVHHGLMLAALIVALRTFAGPWHPASAGAAVAPAILLLGHNGHFVLLNLVEAVLTLYLAIASAANQRRRKTGRSMRAAGGFLLIFLGHLMYFLLLHAGAPRPFAGEALTFAGVLLLLSTVPRPARLQSRGPSPQGEGGR